MMQMPAWIADRLRPLSFGEQGERAAAGYLRRRGYRIVASRQRMRYGEIDLIAVDVKTIVFIEVKSRRSSRHSRPALAVDHRRRGRLTRAALAFLKAHGLFAYPSRFDIVEVVWPHEADAPQITHHRNAFPAQGRGQFFR